jgi:choline kinase
MGEMTSDNPKPLIEINRKSLLERVLVQLSSAGVTEVYLIVGYKKELISERLKSRFPELKIEHIYNPFYAKLNNLFSVWLGRPYLSGEDFLLLNGDIVFEDAILEKAVKSDLGNFSVIDTTIPLSVDSMKVKLDGTKIIDFGKGLTDAQGFTQGIHRFSKEGSVLFFDEIGDMLEKEKDDYHHAAILNLVKQYGFVQNALLIEKMRWFEIDEPEDIKVAEEMFKD